MKLEHYHYDEVKELEDLYSKKLAQEGDAYLKLEQQGLELKQAYERRIADIKSANEKAIRKLMEQFRANLLKVQEEMKESQSATQHLKVNYEKKLLKQDDEHEFEVVDNHERHKKLK